MTEVIDHTKTFLAQAENAIEKAVTVTTIRIQREAHRLVTQRSGPTVGAPNRPASAPGEPPHVRTGTLSRSIDHETFRRGNAFVGRIGSNLDYARYLEQGTSKETPSLSTCEQR